MYGNHTIDIGDYPGSPFQELSSPTRHTSSRWGLIGLSLLLALLGRNAQPVFKASFELLSMSIGSCSPNEVSQDVSGDVLTNMFALSVEPVPEALDKLLFETCLAHEVLVQVTSHVSSDSASDSTENAVETHGEPSIITSPVNEELLEVVNDFTRDVADLSVESVRENHVGSLVGATLGNDAFDEVAGQPVFEDLPAQFVEEVFELRNELVAVHEDVEAETPAVSESFDKTPAIAAIEGFEVYDSVTNEESLPVRLVHDGLLEVANDDSRNVASLSTKSASKNHVQALVETGLGSDALVEVGGRVLSSDLAACLAEKVSKVCLESVVVDEDMEAATRASNGSFDRKRPIAASEGFKVDDSVIYEESLSVQSFRVSAEFDEQPDEVRAVLKDASASTVMKTVNDSIGVSIIATVFYYLMLVLFVGFEVVAAFIVWRVWLLQGELGSLILTQVKVPTFPVAADTPPMEARDSSQEERRLMMVEDLLCYVARQERSASTVVKPELQTVTTLNAVICSDERRSSRSLCTMNTSAVQIGNCDSSASETRYPALRSSLERMRTFKAFNQCRNNTAKASHSESSDDAARPIAKVSDAELLARMEPRFKRLSGAPACSSRSVANVNHSESSDDETRRPIAKLSDAELLARMKPRLKRLSAFGSVRKKFGDTDWV